MDPTFHGPPIFGSGAIPFLFGSIREANLFTIPHLSFTHSLTRCWQGRGLDSHGEHYLPHHRSVRPPPSWRGLAPPSFWSFWHFLIFLTFFDLFAILVILQQTFRFLPVSASSENTDCRKYSPHKNTDPTQHKTAKIPLLRGARKEKHDKIPIFCGIIDFFIHIEDTNQRGQPPFIVIFFKRTITTKTQRKHACYLFFFVFLFGRSPRLISFQDSQGSISGLF